MTSVKDWPLAPLAAIVLTVAISSAVYAIVEVPAMRWAAARRVPLPSTVGPMGDHAVARVVVPPPTTVRCADVLFRDEDDECLTPQWA